MFTDGVGVFHIVLCHDFLWFEEFASDPLEILAVNTGCTWQSTLGQCADGDQTAHNSQWILLSLLDCVGQSPVSEFCSFDWVVVVLCEHTTFQRSDHFGTLSCRTDILDTSRSHVGLSGWTHVPVCLAVAMHCDRLACTALSVSRSYDGSHCNLI